MFHNIKLSTKIFGGFALVLLLLGGVAFMGFNGLSGVLDRVNKADDVNQLVKLMLEARQQEKNFIIRGDQEYVVKTNDKIQQILDLAASSKARFSDKINQDQMDAMTVEVGNYKNAFLAYVELAEQRKKSMEAIQAQAEEAMAQTEALRKDLKALLQQGQIESEESIKDRIAKADDANLMIKWLLEARLFEKECILAKGDRKWGDLQDARVGEILTLATNLRGRFKDEKSIQRIDAAVKAVKAYDDFFDDYAAMMSQQNGCEEKMVQGARNAAVVCQEVHKDQSGKMTRENANVKLLIMISSTLALISGLLFAFFLTRGIVKPLNRVIYGLNEGAEQVASASGQVSSASQSLAEGTSEQAASIEETSSSLEEMSTMTKQNADNASTADNLMKETKDVVSKANQSMTELTQSMVEISKASQEISKIIKTIDEIAFQTNLLALNAAVEAARAGEAGAGFAVVADEVRNLAMRAAEAAKTTSMLIEGTVKRVKDGSVLVDKTNTAFTAVSDGAEKVAELVGEIAAASREQTQGIDQINEAVSQVDSVVQQNASSAEESASASEELSAQAEQMKAFVNDLMTLIGHSGYGKRPMAPKTRLAVRPVKVQPGNQQNRIKTSRLPAIRKKEISPDRFLPLDEGELHHF